ncbi:MAG: succinyl-diaminopimelate desuccinylase [Gemmatimonadota bacterium]|jgi:succinyl-diaminopimelate desuccinylase|nr:succinyl-diaminopimelate desuccinylase [Gemmatimonadota bacterium]
MEGWKLEPDRSVADELARLTLELCGVPSETGNEARLADGVEARCRAEAGDAAVRRVGNSVICDPLGGSPPGGLPAIALVGHLDTVRCAEAQAYEIRDGRVYGCGASDMKGGVATMLALLEWWREMRGARPVWIFYDREEGPFEQNGLQAVFEGGVLPPLDFALILEPTDGALQLGCVGTLSARVTVRGTRAHAARPWQGENALYRAIPLLRRLEAYGRKAHPRGELVFYEVMNATQAHTANSPNVVPDAVVLHLNYRFPPGMPLAEAEGEVRRVVSADGEVEIRDAAPAGEVFLDHPLLEPWRRAERLRIEPKQAWTDVARFTARGIPAVNFGPGETAQAHQANEWCSVASLERSYAALLRRFLQG